MRRIECTVRSLYQNKHTRRQGLGTKVAVQHTRIHSYMQYMYLLKSATSCCRALYMYLSNNLF